MINSISILILILLQVSLFSSDTLKVKLSEKEKAFLKKHPKITLASGLSFEPFFIANKDGTVSGHDREIANLIEKKTGLKIDVKLGAWKEVQEKTKKKEFDGLACGGYHKDREIYFNQSTPYIQLTTLIFVKKGNPKKIHNIEDLYGKKIAIQKGNALFETLLSENVKNSNEIEIVYYESIHDLIKAIVSNEVDFTIYDETAFYIAKQMGLEQLIEGAFALGKPFDVMFWVRKDFPEAISIINKGLKAISGKEKLEIRDRWFGIQNQKTNNNQINFTKEEIEFLKRHPIIKVSNETNWPPFDFAINSEPTGYSIELMKLIAKKIGVKLEFIQSDSWKVLWKKFCNKEIDIMHPVDFLHKNTSYGIFTSTPQISEIVKFVTKKDFKEVKSIEDLYGYRVAIQKGWDISKWFVKNFGDKITPIYVNPTSIDAFKAVAEGRADAAADLGNTINYILLKNAFNDLKVQGVFSEIGVYEQYFVIRSDMPILHKIFEKVYANLTLNEINELRHKWLEVELKYKGPLTDKEKEYLKSKKEIKMCIDPNWMPLEELKDGKHIGISSEFMKLMQKNIPIDITTVSTKNWSETLNFAKNRKCDIISLAMKTPSRQKYLNFTKPYLKIPLVLATNKNIAFIDDVSLLKNKKIAIVKDFAFSELLKSKYSNLTIVEVQSVKDGLEQVRSGKVFGFADALATINFITKNEFMEDIKIVGRFNENFELSVAIRNDDINLLNIFEKLIENINEGERQAILNKWVSLKYEMGFDYKLFWKILAIILIVVLFIIYRHYILNRVNRELEIKIKEELEKSRKKDNLIFQQNKMASLGEMIGNIAHQWRQPLARVSMIHNYLLTQLIDNKSVSKDVIDEIHNGQKVLQFMSKTIDTFENFYNSSSNSSEFNLTKAVDKVILILKEMIHLNKIEIVKEIKEDFLIDGEINAFKQVILSIVQNSVYFLKSRNIESPKIFIKIRKKDNFRELIISDNAGGIKKESLPYIFDYGFSNRDDNKISTGIGLYIANLIIKEKFNGKIQVQNIKNGVSFKLLLPKYTHEKR